MSAVPRILPAETEIPLSRDAWLAERRNGIGSSDIAAILGADPYRGPIDVYLDKTGRAKDGIETRPMRLGKRLEPIILGEFVEETGILAEPDQGLAWHPSCEIACATPDAHLVERPAGVELKAPGIRQAGHWGRSWSNEYPEHYLAQCAWQMAVKGWDECYLAALLGGQDFRVYRILRDRELEGQLLEVAARFWRDHVVADRAPELDASEAARRYVESRFPVSRGPLRPATAEEVILAEALAAARRELHTAEAEEERIGNLLRESIGEDEGIQVKGAWKIGWKSQRGRTTTDHRTVYAALPELAAARVAEKLGIEDPADLDDTREAIAATLAELEQQNTHTGEPFRVFRPSGKLFPSRRAEEA